LQTSVFLAKLIGPFALLLGLAMLVNRARFHKLSNEFLASPALIFLSGVITFPAGLAIVLTHNRWAVAWPLLITLLGWLALIAGVVRILQPEPVAAFGRRFIGHPLTLPIAAAIYLAIGAVLCFYGYYRR
jgi:uncharacterized membrane protein HdeD (DUF308 family)